MKKQWFCPNCKKFTRDVEVSYVFGFGLGCKKCVGPLVIESRIEEDNSLK